MVNVKDQVAIITGGARGIGEAAAEKLACLGMKTVIFDVNTEAAHHVASRLKTNGLESMAIKADVTKREEVQDAVKQTMDRFGRIDVLVNNAGWSETRSFVDEDETYWDKVISVNLKGPILLSSAVLPFMIERAYGKIVNIASDAARTGNAGHTVYSAAKGGVISFTKSLAREVARYYINVNCVCPGVVDTTLLKEVPKEHIQALTRNIPFRRMGKPSEIADAIAFLCSKESDYITGQVLSVSGGLTMAG
ncbi:MAG: SDR family oxidoreductase [Candidatus Tectomicrobia bacterium]|uniref:SDR family oxidoreductase n=1 Tax=Tectimicrobiota bacterium TaxID=2528274 RepID=A0A933GM20_UNCTE|nr:SDR family oxidoreductase [Candidatus Tectomicrobia bacterium]